MVSIVACIFGMMATGIVGFLAGLWLGLIKVPTTDSDTQAVFYKLRVKQLETSIAKIRLCLPPEKDRS